jgi:AraC-like DNA-binding protein
VFSRLTVTPKLFQEMLSNAFSHDIPQFHARPAYILTDEQVDKLMKILELLEAIARHDEQELSYRHQLLLTQLTIGYEFVTYYRSKQEKKSADKQKQELLNRFCDMVVAHFRESREVKFYADKLHIHPYHLTRVIREASGGMSPAEWIEQYVITLAKKMIETQQELSLKHIAYQLGFTEPSSFYRYFKHATGITAKDYREAHRNATIAAKANDGK